MYRSQFRVNKGIDKNISWFKFSFFLNNLSKCLSKFYQTTIYEQKTSYENIIDIDYYCF